MENKTEDMFKNIRLMELKKDFPLIPEEYIGKEATIRFFQLTPDGIPRFPFAVGFRDYE